MGAAKVLPFPAGEPPDDDADAPMHFERGDHAELAEAVLAALGPDPVAFAAGEFWGYRPPWGIWERIPMAKVCSVAASFAGCPVGYGKDPRALSVSLGAAEGAAKLARYRLEAELAPRPDGTVAGFFDSAAPGVAFRNGFVSVEGGRVVVREHSPDHRARHAHPFDYTPWSASATPLLTEFLDELFADCSEDERAARIALLQEFSGACLLGHALHYQGCLILYGEGANGKSSLLSLTRAMFPPSALCSVPPQKWSERFGLAGLEGKRANFVSETPSAEILDGGAFKAVVTGDMVTAERKHKDPFEFRPIAGHIFSMNWPLTTTDHSAGFWRRPIVLPFSRRFDIDPGRKIEPERAVIAAELAGTVAWAVEGAARAQRQGGYTIPDQSRAMLGEWRDGNDQVRLFLRENGSDAPVPASEFYSQYKEWAGLNGHRNPVSSRMFGLRVMATGAYERLETRDGRVYRRKVKPTVPAEGAGSTT
jgi:putative DNA primase/helicase